MGGLRYGIMAHAKEEKKKSRGRGKEKKGKDTRRKGKENVVRDKLRASRLQTDTREVTSMQRAQSLWQLVSCKGNTTPKRPAGDGHTQQTRGFTRRSLK